VTSAACFRSEDEAGGDVSSLRRTLKEGTSTPVQLSRVQTTEREAILAANVDRKQAAPLSMSTLRQGLCFAMAVWRSPMSTAGFYDHAENHFPGGSLRRISSKKFAEEHMVLRPSALAAPGPH